jgi:hypothetical protein
MTTHTYEEIKKLVKDNNKSESLSDEFVICLIWKESGFKDSVKSDSSTATGLMQITKAVIPDVNKAYKTSFTHKDMLDAAKNIQCGTHYLDLRIKWAKDKTEGIDGYGTGKGYAKSIFACEDCLTKEGKQWQAALHKIHQ